MRARKIEDIKRLEMAKDRVARELVERQKLLDDELILNEKVRRMREDFDEKNE